MRTPRTELCRKPERGAWDEATVHAILDEALYCHLGIAIDGQPYVLPTIHARLGPVLYMHGAIANRMLRQLADGLPCCLTATLVDGLVLARSAFHHSLNYRSVVVLGRALRVDDDAEKERALAAVVEKVMRGRGAACRPPSPAELRATQVLRLPLDEASAKLRAGPPVEEPEDYALTHWAGVVPLETRAGAPIADPELAADTPFPHDLARDPGGCGPRDAE